MLSGKRQLYAKLNLKKARQSFKNRADWPVNHLRPCAACWDDVGVVSLKIEPHGSGRPSTARVDFYDRYDK
jgi:hypothetical protein